MHANAGENFEKQLKWGFIHKKEVKLDSSDF